MNNHRRSVNQSAAATRGMHRQRGAALVMALGLLAIFTMLGSAYLHFAYLELDEAHMQARSHRAEATAQAGIQAGLGALDHALRAGDPVEILGEATYTFPVYSAFTGAGAGLLAPASGSQSAVAEISITDESGKINLNHAPASVLRDILQVDGDTARTITGSLPRGQETGEDPGRRWLLHVDDLLTRGLLTLEQFSGLDTSLVTVYSVVDHQQPGAYLSVNTAPPEVLAVVLGLSPEAAGELKAQGPFDSMEDLADAAGKAPESFPLFQNPDGSPALGFAPTCFRITSEGRYSGAVDIHRASAFMEAVVLFHGPGEHEFIRWSARRDPGSEPADAEEELEIEDQADTPSDVARADERGLAGSSRIATSR